MSNNLKNHFLTRNLVVPPGKYQKLRLRSTSYFDYLEKDKPMNFNF